MRIAAAFVLLLLAQDKPGQDKVDQKKIDEAINKGGKYLIGRIQGGLPAAQHHMATELQYKEIILYALVYVAGVDESDENFKRLLDEVIKEPIKRTYGASLQALALEAIDGARFQDRIAQCAQFLVDNQCKNGQWFYGVPVEMPKFVPTGGDKPKDKEGTQAKIKIKKGKSVGPDKGDNSNTQYAVLGLRACVNAGVEIPKETLQLAENWWATTQNKDGGWDYKYEGIRTEHSYGGMTAGAVGSLCILKFCQGRKWKDSPSVVAGLKWLAASYSIAEHPKFDWQEPPSHFYYYWLYALERVGMLADAAKIGTHEWYPEGVEKLLASQREDGSWIEERGTGIAETCFAILFLARSTKPLKNVATGK